MKYLYTTLFILMFSVAGFAQPLVGTYYVGTSDTPQGGDPDFATLYEAVQTLYTEGISGNVRFLITGDLEENQNVFLGIDTDGSTITIKPAPGVNALVTFSSPTANSNINGAFVIGASSDDWDSLVATSNVIIDGSNEEDGTSRNLTFTTSSSAATSNYFRILGSSSDVEWRNTSMIIGQESFEVLLISPLRRNDTDWVPTNVTVANNLLVSKQTRTSSRAINIWGVTGTGFEAPQTVPGPIFIQNNDIQARRYGIWLREYTGETHITGNTIEISEEGTLDAFGILVENSLDTDTKFTISGNALTKLQAGGNIWGINLRAGGVYDLHNNSITGFEIAGTPSALEFYGVHVNTPPTPQTITVNAYHNSIVLNDLGVAGDAGWRYRGFQSNSNARINVDFRNNLLINGDNSAITSYGYYQFGTASTVTSDYNNIFVANPSSENTFFGRLSGSGGTNIGTLQVWIDETGLDVNSTSVAVAFEDESKLKLDVSMATTAELKAPRLAEVTVDQAGQLRADPTFKGSHELPESTSVGRPGDMASNFLLAQNYPNPFNPSTTIQFTLDSAADVKLEIYTIDGRRIATLVNEVRSAGTHNVTFDASNLGSGMYLYRLTSAGQSLTGRMTLLK
jgi:hypothetical protein